MEKKNTKTKGFKQFKFYFIAFLLIIGIKMLTGETNTATIIIGISALLGILIIIIINFMKYRKEESPKIQQIDELGKELFRQISLFHNFAKNNLSDETYKERINHEFTAAYMTSFVNKKIFELLDSNNERKHYSNQIYKKIFPNGGIDLINLKQTARILAEEQLSKITEDKTTEKRVKDMNKFVHNYDAGLTYGRKELLSWENKENYVPHQLIDFLKSGIIK